MATDGSGTTFEENDELSSDLELGGNIPKRHARVTVKYNRKELQRRLDVEKWIDESLDRLYRGQVVPWSPPIWTRLENLHREAPRQNPDQERDMPEEVNIDDLIDLRTDEERIQKLKELLRKCSRNTETFIKELVAKLVGVQKQEELQSEGIEHPVICHSLHRHEPYHFNNPQHHPHHHFHHTRGHNQSL